MLRTERIREISIDNKGLLRVAPDTVDFPYIYRAGKGVYWCEETQTLFFPTLQAEDYLRQFELILAACNDEYAVQLIADSETLWSNVSLEIRPVLERFIRTH